MEKLFTETFFKKNNYFKKELSIEDFKFISILKCENLITKTSMKSFTEDILARQGIEEQAVQKDFYIKYKYLRERIFNELLKYNPSYEEKKGKLLSLIQKFGQDNFLLVL